MIPFELKIYSIVYECGSWLTLILVFAWLVYALLLMIRLNRRFWWWLAVLSVVILPLNVGFTWCGWHYRMELRDRYAVDEHGWMNIYRMPPEVHAEYAKHDYRPRCRDVMGAAVWCVLLLPVVYGFGGLGWTCAVLVRGKNEKRGEDGPDGAA